MKTKKVLWLFVAALFSINLQATELYVGSGGYASIQGAINAADDGDKITVEPGAYYENINFLGKAITLTSLDPNDANIVAATIIDGSIPSDVNKGSVVTFNSGEGNDSVLSGFTVTGGTGSWLVIAWDLHEPYWNRCGGGILCCNMSEPTITKNIIRENTSGEGGGIYVYGNPVNINSPSDPPVHLKPVIIYNTILNNDANKYHPFSPPDENYVFAEHGDGGAIVCFQGVDANVSGNILQDNSADYYGGAIHFRQWSNGQIVNNLISGNTSTLGAGIHLTYNSSPLVSNNNIRSNATTGGGGGGIYVYYYSHPVIEYNTIIQNSDSHSSGIAIHWSSEPVIRNNLLAQNIGPVITCKGTSPVIRNNTISDNFAYIGTNSAIFCFGGAPLIENNIITSTQNGYGIFADSDISENIRYNNVWDNPKGNYNSTIGDQTGFNGNISTAPAFYDSANFDYHLQSAGARWDHNEQQWEQDEFTSRCIDAGNPGCSLRDELSAVPGLELPENVRINLGAYGGTPEASLAPERWAFYADITNDGIVDIADLCAFSNNWLSIENENPTDNNRDKNTDFFDFTRLAADWYMQTTWY